MGGFLCFVAVCAQVPFCTRPVYSRVLLFSTPCFDLFINLLFIDQKKKKRGVALQAFFFFFRASLIERGIPCFTSKRAKIRFYDMIALWL